jgi:hypothetical protein
MAKGFGARVLTPQQEKEVKIIKRSILKHFQCLKEPRTGRRQDHNLTAIVTIGILAVLSGADGFVAIEAYGKAKRVREHLTYAISINTYGQKNKTLNFIELYQKKK